MSAPDILTAARWFQDQHSLYVFAVDHPGRPECGGSHRECDGQRGKHPRGQWSRLATLSPRLICAQLATVRGTSGSRASGAPCSWSTKTALALSSSSRRQ